MSQDDPFSHVTGHIGERVNRRVALVTDDFRLYHTLAPYFEAKGLTILGLKPSEEVPASVQAVLGGPPEDPRSVALAADPDTVYLATLSVLDPRRGPGETYQTLRIGIDPGETTGLALLADGAIFLVAEAHDLETAVDRVGAWLDGIEAREVRIQVGDGSPPHTVPLVAAMQAAFPQAHVLTIVERASSPAAPATESRHTDAAIHIAMRDP